MDELNKTDRRLAALRFISQGQVTYSPKSAQWTVSGDPVSGWDFRTFTELRAAEGLLSFSRVSTSGVSKVDLAAPGKKLLTSWLD